MTDETQRNTPTELRAPKGARVMEIDWADGYRGRIPHRVLRGFCPCAECQGHQGAIELVEPASEAALELADIGEVGQYALSLTWADGHATGIYSFRYLRQLCELPEDADLSATSFGR